MGWSEYGVVKNIFFYLSIHFLGRERCGWVFFVLKSYVLACIMFTFFGREGRELVCSE